MLELAIEPTLAHIYLLYALATAYNTSTSFTASTSFQTQ